jgi:hypothetical protein
MRPPRARTWAPRGHTPVIRVRQGGTGSVSAAGLACYRPGFRPRLICRYHQYHGRKGEKKAFTWQEYRDLADAAHRQLPGGKIILIWDKCAVWRFVASPTQSGGIWRNIPGSPGSPGGES